MEIPLQKPIEDKFQSTFKPTPKHNEFQGSFKNKGMKQKS